VLLAGSVTQAGVTHAIPVNEAHDDRPATTYDRHKLMAEELVKRHVSLGRIRGASLRLANLYGPGPRSSGADRGVLNAMVRRAAAGEPLTIYGHGRFLRDYLHVGDAAAAFVAAAARIDAIDGRHFVVGSGVGCTIAEAFQLVAERAQAKTRHAVKVRHVEPRTPLSDLERRNFVADTTRFTQATGWRACRSLAEGIDETLEAFL
jgi:nucleoside-diphosphate-sugar epimerase